MYFKYQILSILLTISIAAFGQVYSGEVVDSDNNAVIFAHVFFKNDQSRGSITNDLGAFSIQVSEDNNLDSLVISVLGYKTLIIDYSDIEDYNNHFGLSSSVLELGEITVFSDTYFRYILKEAISKTLDNYPQETHLQKAYYQNYTISDSEYTELIEADIRMVSRAYDGKKNKLDIYLNQLKKTEDKRILPDILKSDNNKLFTTLTKNCILNRSFLRFLGAETSKTLQEFQESIDIIKDLQLYRKDLIEGDTILTIKISEAFVKLVDSTGKEVDPGHYSLISVNLTDKAVVRVLWGSNWEEKEDMNEVVYRKIDGKYYPSYIRSVVKFDFDKETRKHYSSYSLYFYDLILGKKEIKAHKKGKRMYPDKGLRQIKMAVDLEFWDEYPHSSQVPATEVLKGKF